MKKTTIIAISVFAIFVLIVSSCASRRQFPREQSTRYTDVRLVAKYLNVDTANFRRLERVERVYHYDYLFRFLGFETQMMANRKRRAVIQRQRNKYPETQINDIDHVFRWLREVYSNIHIEAKLYLNIQRTAYDVRFEPILFDISHYKPVEDGFLLMGVQTSHSITMQRPCLRQEREIWIILLVGYDHNIMEVKRWRNPCPYTAEIQIQLHFPEFEDEADVCLPKLAEHSLDSLILANIWYPAVALGVNKLGRVIVSFTVDADGELPDGRETGFEIVKSGGDPSLDRAVLRTVQAFRNYQWIPGKKNGEKVPMEIQVEVEFLINRMRGRHNWENWVDNVYINIVSNRNNCDCVSVFD